MNNSNQGKGRQHINVLRPSTPDQALLADAVDARFRSLCQDYFRILHEELIPPPELDSAILLWRTMVVRHRRGDLRNTAEEYQAVKEVAEWTLKIKSTLVGSSDKSKEVIWS